MVDFLLFRRMLTPLIIQFLFWLGTFACVVTGIVNIAHHLFWNGFEVLVLGPILLRILSEFLIVFFRIQETLKEPKNAVQEKP